MASAVFGTLQSSELAQAVAKSNHLVGAGLQIIHIVGLLLLLASVVLIGLRAFDLGLRRQRIAEVVGETARLFWIGLALAVGSGGLIFLSSAVRYADNGAFDLKIVLLLLAVAAQFGALRGLRAEQGAPLVAGRLAAAASLLLWFGVAGAGRAIGYI